MIPFETTYTALPARFYTRTDPTPVAAPRLLALNAPLAASLGLDPGWLAAPEGVEMLAGNRVLPGSAPIAMAYAGHQFGGWSPALGDGRAHLLGEIVTPAGARVDLQLKGSGPTPWSRRGDGRAWVGPVLREFLVSEAMHALGIPTTRALAAVATGEIVARGRAYPGAVLARVAASHIRVGTFQYFAARGDLEALRALTDYTIARHFPQADGPMGLLAAAAEAQARLIAAWMSVGFIHGVMNTDNMAVSGETIDYGPCAFMDGYDPAKVFSSIDRQGRYAYANQPQIAGWNLAQLATALLPLLEMEEEAAIGAATAAMNRFAPLYQAEWLRRFGEKIGLAEATREDLPLIEGLLARMAASRADFTRSFAGLADGSAASEITDPGAWETWAPDWEARLAREADPLAVMAAANPRRIARNHQIEAVIVAAAEAQDMGPFERLLAALRAPFEERAEWAAFAQAPAPHEEVRQTFCGT